MMDISKEDRMLLAGVEDKYRQCASQYRVTYTNFLDMRQRSMAETLCRKLTGGSGDVRCVFYGGYDDAERTVALFLPDYAYEKDCPLSVIRIEPQAGGRKLTHRDYLGALMGLGLKREMIGDILTSGDGADMIVMDDVREFIMMNYDKAGRTSLKLEEVSLDELRVPRMRTEEFRDTVASLRLDNVIASAFRMSRAKASEAVRSGIVFVNNMQVEKTDAAVSEGDKLVVRGKGKAFLRETGGRTRKDRIAVVIERYL